MTPAEMAEAVEIAREYVAHPPGAIRVLSIERLRRDEFRMLCGALLASQEENSRLRAEVESRERNKEEERT